MFGASKCYVGSIILAEPGGLFIPVDTLPSTSSFVKFSYIWKNNSGEKAPEVIDNTNYIYATFFYEDFNGTVFQVTVRTENSNTTGIAQVAYYFDGYRIIHNPMTSPFYDKNKRAWEMFGNSEGTIFGAFTYNYLLLV